MPDSPRHNLFSAAHDAVAHSYGDKEQVAAVVISTRSGLRIKMDVPVWWRPGETSGAAAMQTPTQSEPIGCSGEIIKTLRDVGHRLTGELLHDEMAKRGFHHAVGKVKGAAATLHEMGRLTNCQNGDPKGYGLPEWGQ